MKDIYIKDVDGRIEEFLARKTKEFPELRMFDHPGQRAAKPQQIKDIDPRYRS